MIALMSSVPEEGKLLIGHLKKKSVAAGKPVYRGRMRGREVVYMISGMGKTNAAHASTFLLEKFSPCALILFGVGGAYPFSGLEVGDVAISSKEVYGDEGVFTSDGFHGTEFIGIPLVRRGRKRYFNEFLFDRKLVAEALKSGERLDVNHPHIRPLAREGKGGIKVKAGTFVTVSACTGAMKRAQELRKRFGAICENMEGASAAHVCTLYGIPMMEIRGISNLVGDRDRSKWDIALAAENCQRVVMEVLGNR